MPLKEDIIHGAVMFASEFFATFIFLYLGCMGCVKAPSAPNTHLQACMTFGLTVLICVQNFGYLSGSNINPAITLAKYIAYGNISIPMVIVYIVAQMLGATVGYGCLMLSLPESLYKSVDTPDGVCLTKVLSSVSLWQAVIIEFLLTSFLIGVCCAIWDPRNAKNTDGTAVRFGLAVVCLACAGAPFTGASMNPARSFAPALWNNYWADHWVHWVGPLGGGIVTAVFYRFVFLPSATEGQENPDEKK